MSALSELPVCQKVYAYILQESPIHPQILVFEHVDFPEAGIQVPGGSVESGEDFSEAAQREAVEETGLTKLILEGGLGSVKRDMRGLGLDEVHHRHYFQFSCSHANKQAWVTQEMTPSDGSEGPIVFRCFWVDLDSPPELHGGLGEMLSNLR